MASQSPAVKTGDVESDGGQTREQLVSDAAILKDLPRDKSVAVGVIDVRSLEIEAPEQVAERIRAVLAFVPPERVTVTTDCGMKQLPRTCARQKLVSLVAGAQIVRKELAG